MQIRDLPSTSTVESTDYLVKEQSDGTTQKIAVGDFVVNDLTSTATDKPGSANMIKTLATWTEVTLGMPSSGTLVNGSKLMVNNALKLAWLNIQVNGASADTTIPLNCSVVNVMNKPIYGYNGYNNVPVNCEITAENKLLIRESAALVRILAVFPASLTQEQDC